MRLTNFGPLLNIGDEHTGTNDVFETRTSLLKGGFDTFTTVLVSQMLNEGMSEQSYAMSSFVSFIAIAVIGSIIIFTLLQSERLERVARAKAEPQAS